jgi:hypothetical protein
MEELRIYDPIDHRRSLLVEVGRKISPSGWAWGTIPDVASCLIREAI